MNRIGTRGVDDTGTMVGSAKKLDQVPTPNALSETCISLLSLNTRRTFPVPYLNGSCPDGSFDSTGSCLGSGCLGGIIKWQNLGHR